MFSPPQEYHLYVSAVCQIYDGGIVDTKGDDITWFQISFGIFDVQNGVIAGSADHFDSFIFRENFVNTAVINLADTQQGSFSNASVHVLQACDRRRR